MPYTRDDLLEALREAMIAKALESAQEGGEGTPGEDAQAEVEQYAALAGDDEALQALLDQVSGGGGEPGEDEEAQAAEEAG